MGLEIINTLKKKAGLTNEELSNLSGVPKGTIDKITAGTTKDPKLETLKAIARVLNCSLNDFDDVPHINDKSQAEMYTSHEAKLLEAYRNQPSMQPAVDRLLGIDREDDRILRQSKEVMELSSMLDEEEIAKSKNPV